MKALYLKKIRSSIIEKVEIIGMILILLTITSSSVYSTSNDSEIILSFGLVADIHYTTHRQDEPDRPMYYRTTLWNAREAVEVFNAEEVDFIVALGDTVQESATNITTSADLRTIDRALSNFNGDLHHVVGNHDLVRLTREEFLANTSGAVNETYYFFDKEGFRFIVLDANWEPNWSVHRSVVRWLEETLLDARGLGLQAIIFVHQCLHNHIRNSADIGELFQRVGNVFAVFRGHGHTGGIWYVGNTYHVGVQAMANFPYAVFAIASVFRDGTIYVEGYGGHRSYWLEPMEIDWEEVQQDETELTLWEKIRSFFGL